MSDRVQKTQMEILTRYKRIGNLWTGYYARSKDGPEVFGREFYHAVGELLQGKPLDVLELTHINAEELEEVVFARKARGPGSKDPENRARKQTQRGRRRKNKKS